MTRRQVTLLVPCLNEEKGLVELFKDIPFEEMKKRKYSLDVLVVDNNSTDKTAEVAMELGARVIKEKRKGKGNAIRTGFKNIPKESDFVVMLDGDDTYKPYEIFRMIEPLESGFSEVVIGSRLEGKMLGKSMSMSHRMANWLFTFMARYFYMANVSDVCTGYFAWTRNVTQDLLKNTKSAGFAIEAEMITKMAKMGHKVYSVPITYENRVGESKLVPLTDGIKILVMLIKNIFWTPGK